MEDCFSGKVIAACFTVALPIWATAMPVEDCRKMRTGLRTGDLIFRADDSLISHVVMQVQRDQRYSHVGVVVVDAWQRARVHHAEYDPASDIDGVVAQEVCDYARRSVRIKAMRPAGRLELNQQAVRDAVARIGTPRFNLTLVAQPSDGSVYCTQYAWKVLQQAGVVRAADKPAGMIFVPHLLDAPGMQPVFEWPHAPWRAWTNP